MYFKSLQLKNFRNYNEEEVFFHPKVNILIGNNAQGKTNILEALFIMSLGKSFRTNKDAEMVMFDRDLAVVKTVSNKQNHDLTVEISIEKAQKNIKVNGSKIKKNIEILENVYIVAFSPEDLKIVKDEPEKRRKFINRELCQLKPIYYSNLYKYKKILLQRNTLLRQENVDANMMDVWNYELAQYGSKIMIDRNHFINKLDEISRDIHNKITNGKEHLELIYETNIILKDSMEEQKEIYINKLKSTSKIDFYKKNTSVGPHKDDIKILVDGKDIRHYGSQGQQRTAALSLKLAEIKLIQEETKETPILLLDDVLSELDANRQKYLINSLQEVQLFITTTEINDYVKENLSDNYLFSVSKGNVERTV